jgi:DNA adenine methylase
MENKKTNIKPILKWVGGKTQIMSELLKKFPTKIDNYYEPFVGGGSVLIAVMSNPDIEITGNVFACDLNEALIGTYKNIQTNHIKLFDTIDIMKKEYEKCPINGFVDRKAQNKTDSFSSRESYYFWIRSQYNKIKDKNSIKASAMFIFLNKRGWRGLFRESCNGFNVSYGNYKTVNIIDFSHLEMVRELIINVIFIHGDFEKTLDNEGTNDFVYLDPPYAPEKSTSFTGYTKNGFNVEKHKKLFSLIKKLKCKWLFSNANVELVQEYFPSNEYNVNKIIARRSINSKKPGSKTVEVLINN